MSGFKVSKEIAMPFKTKGKGLNSQIKNDGLSFYKRKSYFIKEKVTCKRGGVHCE